MSRVAVIVVLLLAVLPATADVRVTIEPTAATVGDALTVTLTLEAPEGVEPVREKIGPELGPFSVLEESWTGPAGDRANRWTWTARVAAYRTGELEFPPISISAAGDAEGWTTEALQVQVDSVIEELGTEEEPPEIADLKQPASVTANFAPLWLAGGLLALLLAVAGLAWWLHRRYAEKLAAAPIVEDPFARTPPHEWAFAALQELLGERGVTTDLFYSRLSWILKRYLGGRYRVDLLEHTTDEVRPLLVQAGAPSTSLTRVGAVLADCDAVKFAKYEPGETERKDVVDRVYGIIDSTKPAEPRTDVQTGAA